MSKSIMQVSGRKECVLCRYEANLNGYWDQLPSEGLHKHHVIYGNANRAKSEKWGLWVWLCPYHHEFGRAAVHCGTAQGKENDLFLKQEAQMFFEKLYGHDKWMEEFGKNYTTDNFYGGEK